MPYYFVERPRGLGLTLDDLAAAITRQEGSCSAPGVCQNNNPGNLRTAGSGWPGQTGVDSRGFAVFDSYDSGYAALISQEQTNVNRGLSLSQFFGGAPGVYAGYAPAADNNQPNVYTNNVSTWLGIDPNTPLSALLSGSSGASPSSAGPSQASAGPDDSTGSYDDSGGYYSAAASSDWSSNPWVLVGGALAAAGLLWAAA